MSVVAFVTDSAAIGFPAGERLEYLPIDAERLKRIRPWGRTLAVG